MGFLTEIRNKYRFDLTADRIGPDILFTYWRLFFRSTMERLCKRKFKKFDKNAQVRPGVYLVGCSQIEIGKNVVLRPGTMIHAEANSLEVSVVIEDDVLIGSGVHIYVENHEFGDPTLPIYYQGHSPARQVKLEKGCWIGANVIILPGVIIGKNSVVGAGSVVTKSVPSNSVALGIPAKVVKLIE